jgi:hypothetical protein
MNEPDWKGAYMALYRFIENRQTFLTGYAHGKKDDQLLDFITGTYGFHAELMATESLYGITSRLPSPTPEAA